MAGILSKGITFEVAKYTSSTLGSYDAVANLQEIPSLGGSVDKVDATTLADAAYHYIKGLKEYGDLDFKFIYDNSTSTSNYRVLKDLEDEDKVSVRITLPDAATSSGSGTQFTFDAQLAVSLDSVGVNAPLTFTASAALQSDIAITDPT